MSTFWQKKGNKIITFEAQPANRQSGNIHIQLAGRRGQASPPRARTTFYSQDSPIKERQDEKYIILAPPKKSPREEHGDSPVNPKLKQKMRNVLEEAGNDNFNEADFSDQEKLLRRLENLQTSIKTIQDQEMNAWNTQNQRGTMLKENMVLRDTLDRKEKEYKRLQSTFDQKIQQNTQWEDEVLNNRLEDLQGENQRLRGQLDSIRDTFFENQKKTQETLTQMQKERNELKETLDNMKEELFSKKKERGVWDIEQEQHELKMSSLDQEKHVIFDAISKIKEETTEKRTMLLNEKEKFESLKLKIEQMDKEKIDIERVSDENKEIKNVMLQRIRELEASAKAIDQQQTDKDRELEKEKAREAQILERLEQVKRQRDQLEQTLKMSQSEKLESESAQAMRDKLHHQQLSNIQQEKEVISEHVTKLKDKLKSLEMGIRGKKMEMEDLDTKLKSLVNSRSIGNNLMA